MSKITVLNEKACAVEVPEGSSGWMISHAQSDNDLIYLKDRHYRYIASVPGEIGSWSILGRPEEMTREQCDKVMEGYDGSLYLLLKSKGLNPLNVIILCRKTTEI